MKPTRTLPSRLLDATLCAKITLVLRNDYPGQDLLDRQPLEVIGERWTLLVIRDVITASAASASCRSPRRRPQRALRPPAAARRGGHPRAPRLPGAPPRYEYFLTEKGLDLWPALVALMAWGDHHSAGPTGPPMVIVHKECGGAVNDRRICERCGEVLARPRRAGRSPAPASSQRRRQPEAASGRASFVWAARTAKRGGAGWRRRRSFRCEDRIFIGGEWVEPEGCEPIEVINSTTEEAMGTIPGCTAGDADRAVRGGPRRLRVLVADLARGARRLPQRRSPPGSASAARRSPRRSPRSWACR